MYTGTWLGWPGPGITQEDKIPESEVAADGSQPPTELRSEQVVAVHLTAEEHELYYNGCCNATLWPLFHSMPDRAVFDETFWRAYQAVNEKFARETLKRLRLVEGVSCRWLFQTFLILYICLFTLPVKNGNVSKRVNYDIFLNSARNMKISVLIRTLK